jgi:hypothetical protein
MSLPVYKTRKMGRSHLLYCLSISINDHPVGGRYLTGIDRTIDTFNFDQT